MAHEVFVSYSVKNKAVAEAVVAGLEQDGLRCWIAPRDLLPGSIWSEGIVDAIESSEVMVVILSEDANQSQQVLREVERAVSSGTIIVPFRIEDVDPSRAMGYFLAMERWLDALTPPLERHIRQLAASIRALMRGDTRAAHPVDAPATAASPALEPGQVVDAVVTEAVMDMVTLNLPNNERGRVFSPHNRMALAVMPSRWMSRKYKVGDHVRVRIRKKYRSTGSYSCEPIVE